MPDQRDTCRYCTDQSCWSCEITTYAIASGNWPRHMDGTPYPFVGWGNVLSPITTALKNNTGQNHVSAAVILQGENEDEFTFMSSVPSGSSRKDSLRMFIRAAQQQLEYMQVEED